MTIIWLILHLPLLHIRLNVVGIILYHYNNELISIIKCTDHLPVNYNMAKTWYRANSRVIIDIAVFMVNILPIMWSVIYAFWSF